MRDDWSNDRLQNSAVLGGFLSGSLHALTGADHMVALLPLIFNRRWWVGGSIGVAWGIGHSMSSSSIGCLSYLMKSYFLVSSSSSSSSWLTDYQHIVDFVVGATLILIGIMGYFESSREVGESVHKDDSSCSSNSSSDDCSTPSGSSSSSREVDHHPERRGTTTTAAVSALVAVFINGCVMGLSLDGVPSLAPSLFMDSAAKLTRYSLHCICWAGRGDHYYSDINVIIIIIISAVRLYLFLLGHVDSSVPIRWARWSLCAWQLVWPQRPRVG